MQVPAAQALPRQARATVPVSRVALDARHRSRPDDGVTGLSRLGWAEGAGSLQGPFGDAASCVQPISQSMRCMLSYVPPERPDWPVFIDSAIGPDYTPAYRRARAHRQADVTQYVPPAAWTR